MANNKRFLGRTAKLYIGSAWSTPVWTHVATRDTLAVNMSKTLEDVTADDSDGDQWQQSILNVRSIEFTAFYGEDGVDDATYAALEAAFAADSPLVIAVADGPIATTGTKYRKSEVYVTQLNDQRDVKGVGKVTVTLTQGPTENAPVTETVSGS